MSLIGTDRDTRRLLRASGLTLLLYLALGAVAALLPRFATDAGYARERADRGVPGEKGYPALRLTLAASGGPSIPSSPANSPADSAFREPAFDLSPRSDGRPTETAPLTGAAPGIPTPTGKSDRFADSTELASSAGLSGIVGQSGPSGNSAPEGGAFSLWIDGAIKTRLLYPERAQRRGLEGSVLIELRASADGQTGTAALIRGSGHGLLDRAALDLAQSLFPAPLAPGLPWARQIELVYRLESATSGGN